MSLSCRVYMLERVCIRFIHTGEGSFLIELHGVLLLNVILSPTTSHLFHLSCILQHLRQIMCIFFVWVNLL